MNDLKDLREGNPTGGFADRVMSEIAARPLPRPSLWQRIWRPRTITIRISPAPAIGLLCALAVLAVMISRERPRSTIPTAAHHIEAPNATVLVRFALSAPEARQVSLAGDFNGWRAEVAPAERGPDGVWRLTLPIPQGSWSYSFVVDGKFIEDPLAQAFREDGFGGRNAIVRVD